MAKCNIALYGLGVMGASLAKNLMRHGYNVALYSKNEVERAAFSESLGNSILCTSEREMLDALTTPRVVFLMITAGDPVDYVMESLLPNLSPDDIIIDGGNSHYQDTNRRAARLIERGVRYLGIGVSGGEEGAINGPSMMAGGSSDGWSVCRNMLQTIAAQVDGAPCCDYLGEGGAGHHVKMVHNGIEYAILQLIADIYLIMGTGLRMSHDKILETFRSWKDGPLASYLIDITVSVLSAVDDDGAPLVDKILDVARQKGTGGWTMLDAVKMGVYMPAVSEALFVRFFSENSALRRLGAKRLSATLIPMRLVDGEKKLCETLLAGIICAYAQGIELIERQSDAQGWGIDIQKVISLWRGGCIIRSRLLTQLGEALQENVPNIIVSERLSYIIKLEPSVREIVTAAMGAGLPVPTLASVLSYYDCCRAGHMPLNLVQALRDCFGAHTYERVDREGVFHTIW